MTRKGFSVSISDPVSDGNAAAAMQRRFMKVRTAQGAHKCCMASCAKLVSSNKPFCFSCSSKISTAEKDQLESAEK